MKYKKSLDGRWICYDENGNRGKGKTKELAKKSYLLVKNNKKEEENSFDRYFKEALNED